MMMGRFGLAPLHLFIVAFLSIFATKAIAFQQPQQQPSLSSRAEISNTKKSIRPLGHHQHQQQQSLLLNGRFESDTINGKTKTSSSSSSSSALYLKVPKNQQKDDEERIKQDWDLQLLLVYMTPWKNPNSIFVYMFALLYALGKYSESMAAASGN